MPRQIRVSTEYSGVYFVKLANQDQSFFIRYKRNGKSVEEKAGRSNQGWNAEKAYQLRTERMSGTSAAGNELQLNSELLSQQVWTFSKLFSEYYILLCPVSPTVAYKHDPINHNGNDLNFNPPYLDVDGEIIEGRNSIGATIPADLSGFPAISLPFGFSNKGLPIGVQLIGRYAEDSSLLGLSLCFESHTKGIKNYPYD